MDYTEITASLNAINNATSEAELAVLLEAINLRKQQLGDAKEKRVQELTHTFNDCQDNIEKKLSKLFTDFFIAQNNAFFEISIEDLGRYLINRGYKVEIPKNRNVEWDNVRFTLNNNLDLEKIHLNKNNDAIIPVII